MNRGLGICNKPVNRTIPIAQRGHNITVPQVLLGETDPKEYTDRLIVNIADKCIYISDGDKWNKIGPATC